MQIVTCETHILIEFPVELCTSTTQKRVFRLIYMFHKHNKTNIIFLYVLKNIRLEKYYKTDRSVRVLQFENIFSIRY